MVSFRSGYGNLASVIDDGIIGKSGEKEDVSVPFESLSLFSFNSSVGPMTYRYRVVTGGRSFKDKRQTS